MHSTGVEPVRFGWRPKIIPVDQECFSLFTLSLIINMVFLCQCVGVEPQLPSYYVAAPQGTTHLCFQRTYTVLHHAESSNNHAGRGILRWLHDINNTFTTFPWPEERTDSAIYVSCTYGTIRCNRPSLTRYTDKRSVSTVVIVYSGIV